MKTIKIAHRGSRYTYSYFKNENKDTVIVCVLFESGMYGHNALTVLNHSISVIKYKCRTKEFKYCSKDVLDDRYKEYITEQQLYEAYHNHWDKLNPIRLFDYGSYNGVRKINENIKRLSPSELIKDY